MNDAINKYTPPSGVPEKAATWEPSALDLATLAARICPELCQKQPPEAIKAARSLLVFARADIRREEEEKPARMAEIHAHILQTEEKDRAEEKRLLEQQLTELRSPYDARGLRDLGVRFITGCSRSYLAQDRFEQFLKSTQGRNWQSVLARYRAKGFSGTELLQLRDQYKAWWTESHRTKGKQGRVKRPNRDRRKRARPFGLNA